MNYYALLYELVDDMVNRRIPFREEHLHLAREARERGELILAGALSEPVDRALLVFLVDDKSKVEAFARKDPYVINGLAKKWEVRPWNVVVGNEPFASSSTAASPSPGIILRHWTARASQEQWPRYRAHFSIKVLPDLRRVAGFLGATLFVRHSGDQVEILVETSWRSLESIRAFAGPDVEAAVVSDEAIAMLTEFDGPRPPFRSCHDGSILDSLVIDFAGNHVTSATASRGQLLELVHVCGRGSPIHSAKINLNQGVFWQVDVAAMPRDEEHERGSKADVPCGVGDRRVAHRRPNRANGSLCDIVGNLSDKVGVTGVNQTIHDSGLAPMQRAFFVESEAHVRIGFRRAQRAAHAKRFSYRRHDAVDTKVEPARAA
jgi:uncharacterized protein YciI